MSAMTYDEAIGFLESFIDYEKIFGSYYTREREELASIRALLKRLGNPEKELRCVHIAGTKGKGSTAAMTASIFAACGMKTGLYTSPHLVDFRERIRVNARMISKEDCVKQVEAMKEAAIAVHQDPAVGELSFFEVYTALAFAYFRDQHCDLVVVEPGLGGRLDATNVITPLASAITLIGHDHEAILGDTLDKIALEKAGILKHGIPAVIAPQSPLAGEALAGAADRRGVPIYWLYEGVPPMLRPDRATHNPPLTTHWAPPQEQGDLIPFRALDTGRGKTAFSLEGILRSYPRLEIPLPGHHQIINGATAVVLAELAARGRFPLPAEAVDRGLRETNWPGRFQIVGRAPAVVLDGAHNPESAAALRRTLKEYLEYERLILVFGGMRDHNLRAVAEILFPLAEWVILTRTRNPRAATPEALRELAGDLCKRSDLAPNTSKAMDSAYEKAGPGDAILFTGSLYLVGEVLSELHLEP